MAKQRVLSVVVAGISTVLLASAASGAVSTSYPGTGCMREISTTQNIVYQNSRASNISTSSVFYACPAVQQGGLVSAARVSGRDISLTAGVSCHIEAKDPNDGSGSFGSSVSTTAAFTGNFSLRLPPPAAFFVGGSKVVHCTLPAGDGMDGSSIGSYLVNEM